jgi:excisionase family DNA binding protein
VSELAIPLSEQFVDEVAERVAARLVPVDDGYLDVDGAAEFLACPKSRIYALVSAKRIPFYKDGSRTLFDRRELRDWVRAGGAKRP